MGGGGAAGTIIMYFVIIKMLKLPPSQILTSHFPFSDVPKKSSDFLFQYETNLSNTISVFNSCTIFSLGVF